jgi:hypothetical protein
MLEIGLEVFYGNTKVGAISTFVHTTTQTELRDEYINIVKENLRLDLNETGVAFYPALEGKFAKLLKQLAKEKGLWFKLK